MGNTVTLTYKEAWELGSRIRELLESKGKQANLCVFNKQGQLLLMASMDEPRLATAEIARYKARQAALCGRRTGVMAEAVKAGKYTPEIFGIKREEFIPFPGGVPIYTNEKVLLGGVGVSGLRAEEDEAICIGAVEAMGYLADEPT